MIDRSKQADGTRRDPWRPGLRHVEHIDVSGHLNVPLKSSLDRTPKRDGWEPFFVSVILSDEHTQKVVIYRKGVSES
jgi:hypothetical protein